MRIKGLNFFPFPARQDEQISLILLDYGVRGVGAYTVLMSQIFGDKGYYMTVDKYTMLGIKRKLGLSEDDNIIERVIADCVNYGTFNKEKYEKYNILTSADIQKDYLIAVRRRKDIELICEYIVNADLPELQEYFKACEKNRLKLVSISGKVMQI